MSISIAPLDIDDESEIAHAYRIRARSLAVDEPEQPPACRRRFLGQLRHPQPRHRQHWALARLDGEPAGHLWANMPETENLSTALVRLTVAPEARRRGVGRALYAYLVELMRSEGRRHPVTMVARPLPGQATEIDAGTAFATSVGATPALRSLRSRLDLSQLERSAYEALRAEASSRASGYRVIQWSDPAAEEHLADLAYLEGRLLVDAPSGELDWEGYRMDPARLREMEAARAAWGVRAHHSAVRHEASGRLVAWTTLEFQASVDWHGLQQITIVDPEHRGRRLGLLVKIENLRYALAREPGLRVVDTYNADRNRHMLDVNHLLGFRPAGEVTHWRSTI